MNKAEKVRELMMRVLFKKEELVDGGPPADAIVVEGLMGKYGFHAGRVAEISEEVRYLLNEMPDSFHKEKGGGMSFLQLCMDKHDEHWAEHPTMNDLICLGLATKMASYCMPRDYWHVLPGGMPYVTFDTKTT